MINDKIIHRVTINSELISILDQIPESWCIPFRLCESGVD